MVILSVSVCNKKGKILIARQYVPMTRLRIEGLLAAFPKLVDSDENASNKQHTFIETDEVRYVYQPMDTLYLLLITNMQSNILEDLSTLRMIAKLIPEYCGGHDEEAVSQSAFELLFALDEVISPMGYREQVNYSQIDDFVKMDSAEEKLVNIINSSKELTVKQLANDTARMFDQRRREVAKKNKVGFGIRGLDQLSQLGGYTGFGNDNQTHISSEEYKNSSSNTMGDVTITSHSAFGNKSDDEDHSYKKSKKSGSRKMGFKLNSTKGKKKDDDLFNAVLAHDRKTMKRDAFRMLDTHGFIGNGSNAEDEDISNLPPLEIRISESMDVCITDDQIQRFVIKGIFEVIINLPNASQCVIECEKPLRNSIAGFRKIPWKLHPRMDQSLWENNAILKLKDDNKSYKIGRSNKTAILKWNLSTKEDVKPIEIVFWPEAQNEGMNCNVNYHVSIEDCVLCNVIITFPVKSSDEPEIVSCEGNQTFDKRNKELQWILGDLESGSKGSIEYNVFGVEIEDLYPVSVHFEMKQSYCPIKVLRVFDGNDDEEDQTEYEFTSSSNCVAHNYSIQCAY